MQPAFGRQHRLPQKWPESMYLLDKKIYLKFHQIKKNQSVQKSESEISARCVKIRRKWLPGQTIKTAETAFRLGNLTLCEWIYMVKWWSTPKVSCNSGVVCLIDCLLNWTLFCQNPGFGTLRFWALTFFWNSNFLNIFSYRADTSIPITFVVICVIDSKPVAYLRFADSSCYFGNQKIK